MHKLPTPSAPALAISQQLTEVIRQRIQQADGWIPFSLYMELALYAPGLGYYSAGSHKLGHAGDFTTAPEMTPLFARTLAQQLAELLPQTAGNLYEFGAGSGQLAIDLLSELQALGQLPTHYFILDLSPDLIERQQQRLQQAHPQLMDRISWLSELPASLDGIVIGNEVLDAMPCELIHWTPQAQQRGVSLSGEQFSWVDRPIQDPVLQAAVAALPPQTKNYVSEISLVQVGFIHTLAAALKRGGIILIDYGFPAHEYYHPQRSMGTLLGHYRHHTVDDPFFLPGLMDLTCHVDFSAIAQAGIEAGLDLIGYTNQAQFLLNAGIGTLLQQLDPHDTLNYLPQAAAVQKLLGPAEMGELFKVVGWGKGISIDWCGFSHGDRCYTL
ncbi:SAM-dependent methyltransferase [Neisseriaceae bacterium TC5R-5]|nr:SAM-dependent methyltransferase [Neisseriaceae bacterium TC5R-5]